VCLGSVPEVPIENFVSRFQSKRGRDVLKPTIRNESLHEVSNDNRVSVSYAEESNCREYNVPTSQRS
jgi:hypothetical protein